MVVMADNGQLTRCSKAVVFRECFNMKTGRRAALIGAQPNSIAIDRFIFDQNDNHFNTFYL